MRAVALLHSFEFGKAIEGFTAVLAQDPECAIAYWGMGLSRWGNPFAAGMKPAAQLEQGRIAIERARSIGAKTERERDYIAAVARLFMDFEKVDRRTRLLAYRDAMEQVAARYGDDPEASIFYALALAASADPADKTYASLLKAGAILEPLARQQPDHPGLAHYIIHSYDVPPLAQRALEAARRYAKIAPSAPHALHMPSHTFTRLGYWQESIDTNIASAEAAQNLGATSEQLHAMDYQIYAYLQTAQDAAARGIVEALPLLASRLSPDTAGSAAPVSAGVFAVAAIPARYALERGAWAEAVRLEPNPGRFAFADAITWFTRALGASHTGDLAAARAATAALQQIADRLAQANESYWAEQAEIQRLGASAWLALAEERKADALAAMRSAADREDRTEKNAVTPGPIAPARELLGYMLLELAQPKEALAEFETALKKEPNRFRTVAGAAEGAARAGETATARKYYEQLLTICAKGDPDTRPQLAAARKAARGTGF
jgi:hypothetical protein